MENGGTKLFLKQYRFDNLKKINEIHKVKFFFAKNGIPVILPIENKACAFVFEHMGKFYSIFPYVSGRTIRKEELTKSALESAGCMLAKIHRLSKDGYPAIAKHFNKGWDKNKLLSEIKGINQKITTLPKKTRYDNLALEILDLKKKLITEDKSQYIDFKLISDHLIHGDYHEMNIFFDKGDKVTHIFDLEKAGIAPRVIELVRSMDYMCFNGRYSDHNFTLADNYLNAYNKIYPITHSELWRGIKAFYLNKVHSLWLEKEHYIHKNKRVDSLLESDLLRLKYFSQHLDDFVNKLPRTDTACYTTPSSY